MVVLMDTQSIRPTTKYSIQVCEYQNLAFNISVIHINIQLNLKNSLHPQKLVTFWESNFLAGHNYIVQMFISRKCP